MESIIIGIQKTPIPTILIVAGLFFVLLGFTTKLGGFIEVSSDHKKLTIPIGVLILITGLVLTIFPVDNGRASMSPAEPTESPALSVKPPTSVIKEVHIEKYDGVPGTQRSQILDAEVHIETSGVLKIKLDSKGACSQYKLFIYLDDNIIKETDFFQESSGLLDLGPVSPGKHILKLSPEGRVHGCNEGHLMAWGGDLKIFLSN